ncbi:Transposase IS116/IS110/IS902 family protein [compost metagenome]
MVKESSVLKEATDILTSIPGVGLLTAITVLAETNGFEMIRNKKQLVSYAGLDIKEKQSGISIQSKPTISKRGNRHLRKALHLPALVAIRHEEHYSNTFSRLASRHGIKMKAAVAVQRKLLELMFVIYRRKQRYDPQYRIQIRTGNWGYPATRPPKIQNYKKYKIDLHINTDLKRIASFLFLRFFVF